MRKDKEDDDDEEALTKQCSSSVELSYSLDGVAGGMRPNVTASVEQIRDLAARKRTSAMKQKSNLHFIE